ncbi:hypothetical protein LOAG_12913 [Loa loa]|uniref:Uncharacterized protein n=1 Tax=Loa loa TaxID=7209 RepID=A0A1S0TKG2_LOALO|nr:hypothetical protein LOAG_12913 [Loa loa]EFO15596.1 hypothetical protein LOAG_12913 [Loa loa]
MAPAWEWYQYGCVDETLSHCCHAGMVHSRFDEKRGKRRRAKRRVARLLHNALASQLSATFRDILYLPITLLSVSHTSLTSYNMSSCIAFQPIEGLKKEEKNKTGYRLGGKIDDDLYTCQIQFMNINFRPMN